MSDKKWYQFDGRTFPNLQTNIVQNGSNLLIIDQEDGETSAVINTLNVSRANKFYIIDLVRGDQLHPLTRYHSMPGAPVFLQHGFFERAYQYLLRNSLVSEAKIIGEVIVQSLEAAGGLGQLVAIMPPDEVTLALLNFPDFRADFESLIPIPEK